MTYVQAGDFLAARERFQDGVERARSLGSGANGFYVRFLINVANTDLALHQYESAMQNYLEAKGAAEAAGDRTLASVAGANIGWLYSASGSFEDASESLRAAMATLPPGARASFLGNMLHEQMIVEVRQDRWDRAREAARSALDLADETNDLNLQADILDAAGYELLRVKRWRQAEPLLVEAFRLRRTHSLPVTGQTYRNLGLLQGAAGDLEGAERFLNAAVEADRATPDALAQWTLYYHRASIREAAGRHREALDDLERAMELIRAMRVGLLPADAIRTRAGVSLRVVYDAYLFSAAQLYETTGDTRWLRRSFEVSQQGRAIGLVETLREDETARKKLGPEFWQTLQLVIAAERDELLAGKARSAPQGEMRVEALRHRLTELEVRAGLAGASDPIPPPVSTGELQRRLAGSEALLAFAVTERSSYLWTVTNEGIAFHSLPPAPDLRRQVEGFRTAVERNEASVGQLGRQLYDMLFGTLEGTVKRKRDWILLPDDILLNLPFAALISGEAGGQPRYLVEDHSLRAAPGAGLLLKPARKAWGNGLVAVGDPIYNRADPRWKPPFDSGKPPVLLASERGVLAAGGLEVARLAGSAEEVETSLREWQAAGGSATSLVGDQARVVNLLNALELRPAVLHFATHVLPGPGPQNAGYLALSLDAEGVPELMGVSAIASLKANPDLVVMSGCNSGQGRILPGEGLLGLTRAWLRAGARQVMATRWTVSDDQGELLGEFYRELLPRGENGFRDAPHRALQAAQIRVIRGRGWRSEPRYWAAYFLISSE